MDRAAFREFLFNLSLALHAAGEGDPATAEAAFLDASLACGDAFPLASRESGAMGIILAAAAPAVNGATP